MKTAEEPKRKRPYKKPPRRPPMVGSLDGVDLLLTRRDLTHRWGCCLETVKRLERAGKIHPYDWAGCFAIGLPTSGHMRRASSHGGPRLKPPNCAQEAATACT